MSSDPFVCNIPLFLLHIGATPPRKRRWRGTRRGRLVRLKTWLTFLPDPASLSSCLTQDYKPYWRRLLLGRSLLSVGTWLVPIAGEF